jgi:subtilase family serine protease
LANVKPNLAITSSNIAFSNSMPALGGTVAVTATVKNTGFEPVSNVVVNFYDHDPTSGAPAIASKTIAAIPAGGSALASIPYVITTTGMSSLFVVLDPSNQIDEITKLDNTASNRLWGATIPDLAVFSSDLKPSTYTPASNTAFTLQYAVRNLGESATNGFDVAVYDGSPTGTPLQTGHISGIGGTETRTGTFGVTLTGDGPHTLYIVADPGNAITETTKTNNTTRWKRT